MPTKSQVIRHQFGGGWATDFGPTADVGIEGGQVVVPFLTEAENIIYELDGGPHKVGGVTKVNSSGLGSTVTGIYDYWRQGTAGSPARRRIAHAGTVIYADNDDGTYASIFTGLESGAIPSYATFDDLLIISSNSTTDVPKSWDQTTAQNLAGSPPNFSFAVVHHGRVFAAGDAANPSDLSYTAAFDPEDWIGAGSGTIQIDPNDGDHIVGIASHKNDLFVFKGPYKGSIHRITGTSPTDFARATFVTGLGGAWHNSIFKYGDDIGFVSQFGTVHSLTTTASYGDYHEGALSRPIHEWIKEKLNYNRLENIWAAADPLNSRVLIAISIDANSTNNAILSMDYSFNPPRWAYWSVFDAESLALFQDTNGVDRLLFGGSDGFVRNSNVVDRSVDGSTAISMNVKTPSLNYGNPMMMKTISQASVGIAPRGDYTGTFGWVRDDNTVQTQAFTQGGGDVLAPAAANEFTLGTSTLAGSQFVDRFMELEEGGEFRSVSYEFQQAGLSEDLEVHAFSATISGGALSTEN